MSRPAALIACLVMAALHAGPACAQTTRRADGSHNDLSAARSASPSGLDHLNGAAQREPAPARAVKAADLSPSRKANPLWAIPLDTLRATHERPLFSASRRPPPPPVVAAVAVEKPAAPAPPAEPEKPQLTLVGVVHGAHTDIGIFFDQAGQLVRLRVGQERNGWVMRSVDMRKATLNKASQEVLLELPARNAEITAPPHSAVAAANFAGAAPLGALPFPPPPPERRFEPGMHAPCDLAAGC